MPSRSGLRKSYRCSRSRRSEPTPSYENGQAADRTVQRPGDQEPRDRDSPSRAGGQGRAAGSVVSVQVRVPGQHEPRAAHSAEQPAHPGQAADREPATATSATSRWSSPAPSTASGTDLLQLINDILDLSKVEAGKMDVHVERGLADAHRRLRRGDLPAAHRGPGARLRADRGQRACRRPCITDEHRLQQILRNLLSNAVKFTEHGTVRLVDRAGDQGPGVARPPWWASRRDRLLGRGHRHRHPDRASCGSSSRRSSRPTAPPAGGTAAPGWA